MQQSSVRPSGLNVGFIRLHRPEGASHVYVVDLTRCELSPACIRFREENWIVDSRGFMPSSEARNTDNFTTKEQADEFFAWWLQSKLEDKFNITQYSGIPGPMPEQYVKS